jgi:hypothetical protein
MLTDVSISGTRLAFYSILVFYSVPTLSSLVHDLAMDLDAQ